MLDKLVEPRALYVQIGEPKMEKSRSPNNFFDD